MLQRWQDGDEDGEENVNKNMGESDWILEGKMGRSVASLVSLIGFLIKFEAWILLVGLE